MDEKGQVKKDDFPGIWASMQLRNRANFDYRWNLLYYGSMMNGLRVYRKTALQRVGPFNERRRRGVDLEMALRMLEHYEIALVPEFFYAARKHGKNTSELRFLRGMRYWWERFWMCNRLLKENLISFPRTPEYNKNLIFAARLIDLLRVRKSLNWLLALPANIGNRSTVFLIKIGFRLHRTLGQLLPWWPLGVLPIRAAPGRDGPSTVVFYLWRFPALSATFIRREIKALTEAGLNLQVVADRTVDSPLLGDSALEMKNKARYLNPFNKNKLPSYHRHFVTKHPLRYVNVFFFVLFHRYGLYKSLEADLRVFENAVYLAGVLKEENARHLHLPWSDRTAFTGLLAARLSEIPFSVHARAHDIHRRLQKFALKEKLSNASFVITNSRYNHRFLERQISPKRKKQIHTVYEGIDVTKFESAGDKRETGRLRILSVARLIEEKGLVYLLKACHILKMKGIRFRCEIIGESELPAYRYYDVELKRLHRELNLEASVKFLGPQSFAVVVEAYRRASVFVLPCVIASNGGRDVTPNSLIEAMAMELPVVSTHISAIPEIIEDGESGLLVPPGDELALAAAVEKLASDPVLRRTLGLKARKKVEQQFDIRRNILHIKRLLDHSKPSNGSGYRM